MHINNIIPKGLEINEDLYGINIIENDKNKLLIKINKKEQSIIELIKKFKINGYDNYDIIHFLNYNYLLGRELWDTVEVQYIYDCYSNRNYIGLNKISTLPNNLKIIKKKINLNQIKSLDIKVNNKKELLDSYSTITMIKKHYPNLNINTKIGIDDFDLSNNIKNIKGFGTMIINKKIF